MPDVVAHYVLLTIFALNHLERLVHVLEKRVVMAPERSFGDTIVIPVPQEVSHIEEAYMLLLRLQCLFIQLPTGVPLLIVWVYKISNVNLIERISLRRFLDGHEGFLPRIVNSLELENCLNFLNLFPVLVRDAIFESFVGFQIFNNLLAALGFLVIFEDHFETNSVNALDVFATTHDTSGQKFFFVHLLEFSELVVPTIIVCIFLLISESIQVE